MHPIHRLLPALLLAATAPAAEMIRIPAGDFAPPLRAAGEPERMRVAAFALDERAVTNSDFLRFVTAHPKWRRSQISPLFTDEAYLQHWAGDLELGPLAPPCAPVVRVSWFAARAFARWAGKRLPTTAEWELAAAAGFTRPDGKNDPAWAGAVQQWLARPVPPILPDARAARADFNGVRGLHGLVWEWVEDFSTAMVTGESRADSGLDRDLFCGAGAVSSRDPGDYAAFMRLALRSSLTARHTTTALGFRCAQDLPLP